AYISPESMIFNPLATCWKNRNNGAASSIGREKRWKSASLPSLLLLPADRHLLHIHMPFRMVRRSYQWAGFYIFKASFQSFLTVAVKLIRMDKFGDFNMHFGRL